MRTNKTIPFIKSESKPFLLINETPLCVTGFIYQVINHLILWKEIMRYKNRNRVFFY